MSQQSLDLVKSNTAGGLHPIDPDAQFDKSRGWSVGDTLTNTVTGRQWVCLRDDVNNAAWRATSDGIHLLRRQINTSMWMSGATQAPGSGTGVMTANRLAAVPFLRAGATINRIAFNITAGAAGNARLGIYENDPITGLPGALLRSTGELSTAGTGVVEGSFADLLVPSGGCWLASVFSAAPTVTLGQATGDDVVGHVSFTSPGRSLNQTFTYGALPATYGTPNAAPADGIAPLLMVRFQ